MSQSKDYKRGYQNGYIAGCKKIDRKREILYTPASHYTISIDEQHFRFMHWLRLKFHENANWDTGISTTSIIEHFKNDKEFSFKIPFSKRLKTKTNEQQK